MLLGWIFINVGLRVREASTRINQCCPNHRIRYRRTLLRQRIRTCCVGNCFEASNTRCLDRGGPKPNYVKIVKSLMYSIKNKNTLAARENVEVRHARLPKFESHKILFFSHLNKGAPKGFTRRKVEPRSIMHYRLEADSR